MKYCVYCTKMFNGTIDVEADSKEKALKVASERLNSVNWEFGEQTADFASEIKE